MTPTAQARLAINTSWQEVQKEMNALIKDIEIKHKQEEKDALADSQRWKKVLR